MSEPSDEGPEDIVARSSPDRYIAALFAPPGRRRGLIDLYAFNIEVARIREIVHEPMVGHIRLAWWREQIGAIYEQRAVAPPLANLARTIANFALPRDHFDAFLDARAADFSEAPFADEAALEAYSAATAGSMMKLAVLIAGAGNAADKAAHHAALAVAYAGFIRALGFDAALRFCRLPIAWLEAEGLTAEDVFEATQKPSLERVVARLAHASRRHLQIARAEKTPRAAMAALAPAALVESDLARAASRDLLAKHNDTQQLSRTARIAFSVLTGRI